MCFCFAGEVKKDKDLDEEKVPKTEKDDMLAQIDRGKKKIIEGKESLTDKDSKDDVKSVVVEGTIIKAIKEELMEGDEALNTTSKSTSEKNGGALPSEHASKVKKKSDEIQKALKNDQQAKIPLKKREMKRSEDFDASKCGSGGSSIIVRNPAVKEVWPASEENGLSSENLNGNVSPAVAVEGDGQASDNTQKKRTEMKAISKDQQADAEVREAKKPLSDTKQEEGPEEKHTKGEAATDKSQASMEESMEVEETLVSKGDQETSPKLEEAPQTTEKFSESDAIRADESAKMKVAEGCSKPLGKEASEKFSGTKRTDQAGNEKKLETIKESPNEREMDQASSDEAKGDKTQMGTEAPMDTETSTSQDSTKQQSAANKSRQTVQKADKPWKSEETQNPVDKTSTTLKDCALLERDKKSESGSTKQTKEQELLKEENIPEKESEPLNEEKKLPEDSAVSKEKEKPSLPKENEKTEKSPVCEETNTGSAAKESLKSDHDGTSDKPATPDTEGTTSVVTQKESADQEKRDALKKTEEPPSPAVSKPDDVVNKDKTMEVTSANAKDNEVPTNNKEGPEQNMAVEKAPSDTTSKDCDAEPQKEACGERGMQDKHPVVESKASTEESSKDQKENGEQKSTSKKEASLSGKSTGDRNQAKEKEKTSKGEAGDSKAAPEVPQEGIRLKIKVPAHRRRAELQREEGKGDSESEASEGRCLRRSPRICRPTAKLAEIQDRKVEKKQITPSVEKEKEENEEKEGEENAVQKKPREKKVDQEGQAKPKVCQNVCFVRVGKVSDQMFCHN